MELPIDQDLSSVSFPIRQLFLSLYRLIPEDRMVAILSKFHTKADFIWRFNNLPREIKEMILANVTWKAPMFSLINKQFYDLCSRAYLKLGEKPLSRKEMARAQYDRFAVIDYKGENVMRLDTRDKHQKMEIYMKADIVTIGIYSPKLDTYPLDYKDGPLFPDLCGGTLDLITQHKTLSNRLGCIKRQPNYAKDITIEKFKQVHDHYKPRLESPYPMFKAYYTLYYYLYLNLHIHMLERKWLTPEFRSFSIDSNVLDWARKDIDSMYEKILNDISKMYQ